MSNMSELYAKVKNYLMNDSKNYVVKKTYLNRPRLVLAGMFYLLAMVLVLFISTELVDLSKIFAPLAVFEPITKFFINIETGEPRNILGWVYLIGVVLVLTMMMLAAALGMLFPGFYMLFQGSRITDMEWPDDPEKTKKWRERKNKHGKEK